MMYFCLDGNDWEADYFISSEQFRDCRNNPRNLDNMLMECAVNSNFVRRNTFMPGLLRCTIPGCDRTVLLENRRIRDPYVGRNLVESKWAEDYSWAFRKSFTLSEEWRKMDRIIIDFRGIDYKAVFLMNGKPLGMHEGMFIPAVYDITDIVDFDNPNLLAVVFDPAPKGSPNHKEFEPADFAAYHRTQMSFGWDWSRRFVISGIWDSVILLGYKDARISDCAFRHQGNSVELELDIEAEQDGNMELSVSMAPDNFNGTSADFTFPLSLDAGRNNRRVTFEMPDVELWYPNHAGKQNLYKLRLKLGDSIWENVVGFRSLKMLRNPKSPEGAYHLTFMVNEQTVFARGLNWVPADLMYSRNCRESYERLIALAAHAGFNIFRVWGGGMVEKDVFYELCDRYGILVWQEFMHSCSNYSKAPEYLAFKRDEGEAILRKLRNHVSISMICGGNEMQYYGEKANSPLLEQYGRLVEKFAPFLPYHVSSPDLSRPGERNHGPWHFQEHSSYNGHFRLLASEIGCNGMPEYESLRRFIPEDELESMQGQNLNFHFMIQSGNQSQRLPLEKFDIVSAKEFCAASMFAQADAGEYVFEHYRRLFPRASGCFFWQYNEPWPTCSYSIVDYYSIPKMAYYSLKKANAPLLISLKEDSWCITKDTFQAKCFLTNDYESLHGTVSVTGMTVSGKILFHYTCENVWEHGTVEVMELQEQLPGNTGGLLLVFLNFRDGSGETVFENTRIFGLPDFKQAFRLPEAEIQAELAESAENLCTVRIFNIGETAAVKVRVSLPDGMEEKVFWSDNYICIPPRSTAELLLETSQKPEAVNLTAWNLRRPLRIFSKS